VLSLYNRYYQEFIIYRKDSIYYELLIFIQFRQSVINLLWIQHGETIVKGWHTIYAYIFETCNFHGFRG